MDRRLVIASAVVVLLLLTVVVISLGGALTASGATPAPRHHATMSGDFAHVPMACAGARGTPSIIVWSAGGLGARHEQTGLHPSTPV